MAYYEKLFGWQIDGSDRGRRAEAAGVSAVCKYGHQQKGPTVITLHPSLFIIIYILSIYLPDIDLIKNYTQFVDNPTNASDVVEKFEGESRRMVQVGVRGS